MRDHGLEPGGCHAHPNAKPLATVGVSAGLPVQQCPAQVMDGCRQGKRVTKIPETQLCSTGRGHSLRNQLLSGSATRGQSLPWTDGCAGQDPPPHPQITFSRWLVGPWAPPALRSSPR